MPYLLFMSAVLLLLSGCSSKTLDPEISFKAPQYVQELPSREDEEINAPGSLFGQGDNPMFSDRKAFQVNDVVTVEIVEEASSTSSGNKQISRANNGQLGPGVVTYGGNTKAGRYLANSANNIMGFGLGYNSESTFQSAGSNTRTENFTTTISARIVKVLNNGNYFIEGRREVLVNGEKQVIQLSGVIRPYDIDQTNTILSSYISDAKIMYKTEGEIQRSSERGWLANLAEIVWPF